MGITFYVKEGIKKPIKSSEEAAGYDFFSPVDFIIYPGFDVLVPLGVRVDIPKNTALMMVNKSGVATKLKLTVGACLIDSDYTGEIHLHLFNNSHSEVIIKAGQKIVQAIHIDIIPSDVSYLPFDYLGKETKRGEGGFGSTGTF